MDIPGEHPQPQAAAPSPVIYHQYENISDRPVDLTAPKAKSRLGCWIVGCLFFLFLAVGIGLVGYASYQDLVKSGALGLAGLYQLPVGPRERALLVTASDFAALREGMSVHSDDEYWFNSEHPDDSFNVGYSYSYVDSEEDFLEVYESVWIESSPEAAAKLMADIISGESAGGSLAPYDGYNPERKDDLFRWGEESRCYVLHYEDFVWGVIFIAREGAKIHHLHIEGVVLDAEEIAGLLTPRLEALRRYDPRAGR